MNVVTSNQNRNVIDKLDIDIIKRIDGQFDLKDLLAQFVNLYFNKMIIDVTSVIGFENVETFRNLSTSVDPNRVIILLNENPIVNSPQYMAELIKMGFYNVTRNIEGVKYLYNNPNTFENVKHLVALAQDQTRASQNVQIEIANQEQVQQSQAGYQPAERMKKGRIIVGLQNLSIHAGASTLTNLIVRQLVDRGVEAYGIEMFKQDLMYYHNDRLSACMNKQDLENKLRQLSNAEVVIIDLNEYGESEVYCDEILYLIEPSYIRLTKMLKKDRNVLSTHKKDKIVLNMSFINDQDLPDFEYESNIKVFDNIPPLDDRDTNLEEINRLIDMLGLN